MTDQQNDPGMAPSYLNTPQPSTPEPTNPAVGGFPALGKFIQQHKGGAQSVANQAESDIITKLKAEGVPMVNPDDPLTNFNAFQDAMDTAGLNLDAFGGRDSQELHQIYQAVQGAPDPGGFFQMTVQSYLTQSRYVKQTPDSIAQYNQAVLANGFQDQSAPLGVVQPDFKGLAGSAPNQPLGQSGRAGKPGAPTAPQVEGLVVSPSTGAILYKDGIIADPGTGTVMFPQGGNDPTKVGSAAWLSNVAAKWSPAKVQEWRTKLGSMGYLPVTEAKNGSGTADAAFLNALGSFYHSKYLNYGNAIADHTVDLSQYGANGQKIIDLGQFTTEVQGDIRNYWIKLFGQEPSHGELSQWTSAVMDTASKMQQNFGGVPINHAEKTVESQITGSPQGQLYENKFLENTSLHDALNNAASAMGALT